MGDATPERFRQAAGRFATGVTVVSTAGEGTLHALTVNAFCSVSLDPLLVLVCIDRTAWMHDLLARTGVFAATVLSAGQRPLAAHFASSERPTGAAQFDGVAWWPAPVTASPVLDGGVAWFDCRVRDVRAAGDHSIFVAEVADLGAGDGGDALVFLGGGYSALPVADPEWPG